MSTSLAATEQKLPMGTVSYAAGLDQNHAALMKSLASFGTPLKDGVLRVNMGFVCESMGKPLNEIFHLLRDLQEVQVSVRTNRGEQLSGLVRGAAPASTGDGVWDVHLGGAGLWLIENNRGGLWW